MRRRWLLLAVILTAPSGCDNVTWGGTEVHLQGPGDQPEKPVEEQVEAPQEEAPVAGVPEGPLLLAGTREGDSVRLVVVGTVHGGGIDALPADRGPDFMDAVIRQRLAPGTSVVLFSDGSRVGHTTVAAARIDDRFCQPRPSVSGVIELVPGAASARRFLALVDPGAANRPYTRYRSQDHDYDQRVASLALAQETIRQTGAAWPTSVLESRADIQAFSLPEGPTPAFAATFLIGDRLAVAPPTSENAYSIFVMGVRNSDGYTSAFSWYRLYRDDGKGAPRYFDHLDWDGDGTSEVLLDVFGADHRWFAALTQRNDTWVRSFQDACGSASN